jgi:hypothetical protein
MRPWSAMSTAAGPTGGRALRLSGKSGQSSFPRGEDERERQQRADHLEILKHLH